jgi:hypothetical protein
MILEVDPAVKPSGTHPWHGRGPKFRAKEQSLMHHEVILAWAKTQTLQ